MTSVIIKEMNPDSGRDAKVFRAYFPGGVKRWDKSPVGVSSSTTGNPIHGIFFCAAKAFVKIINGPCDPYEIETRIKITKVSNGIWCADLQPKEVKP